MPGNLDITCGGPASVSSMRFHKHVTALAVAVAAFTAVAVTAAPAPAATPLASKQAQATELNEQVNQIERRYDHLQERYRGAQHELRQIGIEVKAARIEVGATRRDLRVASDRLAQRAAAIYRSGGTSGQIVDIAAGGTISGFFDKLETVRRVGNQDATVLETVEALKVQVERKERLLSTAQARAAKATKRAAVAKEKMGTVLAARQAKLDSVNSDIRAIMDAQRRAAEARAAAAARASAALARRSTPTQGAGASDSGDSSDTGSAGSSESSSSDSGGASIPLPPGSGTAAAAANAAMGKLGSPYVWAGAGESTFDCSGLVTWAFAQAGRSGLPHSTYALVNMGVNVPLDQLQVGDLVFPSHNGHVGIYVGGGSFVHAPRSGDVVKVTSMSNYSISHARRL
ncbi:MAG: Cell wall-associated hydrolase, invasion-associated protein [Thermoleophilia bacterium]|nr:Cell wall-associated hydrolase, invasion-associated protein [Thermoleophilia bacterium]